MKKIEYPFFEAMFLLVILSLIMIGVIKVIDWVFLALTVLFKVV